MQIINRHVSLNIYIIHILTFKINTMIQIIDFLKMKDKMSLLKNERLKLIIF